MSIWAKLVTCKKGYRTLVLNGVMFFSALAALLLDFNAATGGLLHGSELGLKVVMAVNVINIILRAITDTPIFKEEKPLDQ